jgi:regulatory protein
VVVSLATVGRGRRRLKLSDGREFTYSLESCERARVGEGTSADETLFAALDAAEQRVTAHEAALRLLTHREHSESEIRKRLAMHGIDTDTIDGELERLRSAGLLDDGRFARTWVAERSAGRGKRLLRHELAAKGVDSESVEAATAELDDTEAATRLARSRARGAALASYDVFAARAGGFLRRRGFDYATTAAAVRRAWIEATGDREGANEGPEDSG